MVVDAQDPRSNRRDVSLPGRPGVDMRRYDRISIGVEATRQYRPRTRHRSVAADIMRFYGTLMDDTPYESLTVSMLEHEVPGGHSPAYFSIINNAAPFSKLYWGNDPSAFAGVPEFFLATSWRINGGDRRSAGRTITSSGSARDSHSTFSALYAQRAHGDASFTAMLRQFRRWSISESDQGPVDLGYRLGLIQGRDVFSAPSSTTKAPPFCTCCGGSSATKRSSTACAVFTVSRSSESRHRRVRTRDGDSLRTFARSILRPVDPRRDIPTFAIVDDPAR
jgi:hypothetical protein